MKEENSKHKYSVDFSSEDHTILEQKSKENGLEPKNYCKMILVRHLNNLDQEPEAKMQF